MSAHSLTQSCLGALLCTGVERHWRSPCRPVGRNTSGRQSQKLSTSGALLQPPYIAPCSIRMRAHSHRWRAADGTSRSLQAPGFGERKSAYLEDIAILTGATVVKDETGLQLDKVGKEVLGTAAKVRTADGRTCLYVWPSPHESGLAAVTTRHSSGATCCHEAAPLTTPSALPVQPRLVRLGLIFSPSLALPLLPAGDGDQGRVHDCRGRVHQAGGGVTREADQPTDGGR
jgi:hypothetical protein